MRVGTDRWRWSFKSLLRPRHPEARLEWVVFRNWSHPPTDLRMSVAGGTYERFAHEQGRRDGTGLRPKPCPAPPTAPPGRGPRGAAPRAWCLRGRDPPAWSGGGQGQGAGRVRPTSGAPARAVGRPHRAPGAVSFTINPRSLLVPLGAALATCRLLPGPLCESSGKVGNHPAPLAPSALSTAVGQGTGLRPLAASQLVPPSGAGRRTFRP
jgi:hypothetical protein